MIDLAAVMTMIQEMQGTPYITGGDSARGTDCSGLASFVSNIATGRPTYGDRFHTANEAAALRARGFQDGTAPNALVIGWNGGHTAVTLPDGTPVSSGEGGGVRIGGGGAYQPQFTHHMFLPMPMDDDQDPGVVPVDLNDPQLPPPPMDPPPVDAPPMDASPVDAPAIVNADNVKLPAPPADSELPPQAA